ncbi:hypothetical protein IKL64_09130 [bacterium]|nr:hypothetical protein [bacterium]
MRVGTVLSTIGITATLVCVGSVLTGLGTRNRKGKRQAIINRLYQPNQLSRDIVQIKNKTNELNEIGLHYQDLQVSTYNAMKKVVANGQEGAKLIRKASRN